MPPRIEFFPIHPCAQLPTKAHDSDTGYDLYCVEDTVIEPKNSAVVPIGLQVAYLTEYYWFRIEPRSGLGFKNDLQPHLGVIDNPYRGSLDVKIYNFSNVPHQFKRGDRVAQIAFYHLINMNVGWSNTIEETDRGEKGFGSSGR